MQAILQLFLKTFDDHKLSDEEQKILTKILDEQTFYINDIGYLRNRLFEFAKNALSNATPLDVFKWLEKVNKILARLEREAVAQDFKSNAFFTPGDDCCYAIRGFIQRAKDTLDICVFTISDDNIAKDILIAKKRDVAIRIITDNDKMKDEGSDIKRFFKAGIPVKTDSTSNHMHHKFAIIDGYDLLTGSYNWTKAAAKHNHENILITQHADLVASYQKEFDKLWEQLKEYNT